MLPWNISLIWLNFLKWITFILPSEGIWFGFTKKKLIVLTDGQACYIPTCTPVKVWKHLHLLSFTQWDKRRFPSSIFLALRSKVKNVPALLLWHNAIKPLQLGVYKLVEWGPCFANLSLQQHRADFPSGLRGCTLSGFPSLAAVWCLSCQSTVLSQGSKPGLRIPMCTFLPHLCIHLCIQRNCVQTADEWVEVGAL